MADDRPPPRYDAELRALADYVDGLDYVAADPQACKDAAAIIRALADLQEPARYALRREKGPLRESQLAGIVERIVGAGE